MLKKGFIGPCAKKQVWTVLEAMNGDVYIGVNLCRNPQEVCPREPGEGYEKCHTICETLGHAEDLAIQAAGTDAEGAHMTIGHHRVCDRCREVMLEAGVLSWVLTEERAER
jgi:hypothetical protein